MLLKNTVMRLNGQVIGPGYKQSDRSSNYFWKPKHHQWPTQNFCEVSEA